MKTVNPATANHMLRTETKDGTFFSVKFVKKTDGKVRTMICRRGVKKGVKGTGHNFSPPNKGLLQVWDVQKKAFRFISLSNVIEYKIKGQSFQVELEFYKKCMEKN